VFVGNPAFGGITTNATFGTNAFGMYANPGTSGAFASVDRTFGPLQEGQTFSFQWAINWDSDVGNKGFSLYSGGASGTQILNVNQGGFPGDIRFIGGGVTNTNIGLAFGTQAMTWSFAMTSSNNLLVTSTPRDGSTNIAFSTNIAVTTGPDSFRWYVSAMSAGDQRQQYYNNLQIVGASLSGNVAPTTIYVRLSGETAGSPAGNIDLTSSGAAPKTVTLNGTVLPRPVITPTASLTNFVADLGTNSDAQPFTFAGTNLVGDVTVTAPSGYEIAKTTNGTYTNTLTYSTGEAQPGPATNWVRLATNAPAGFVSGNVSLASQGAVTTNVAVTGRVIGDPVIALSPTNLTNFFAPFSAPSDPQTFTVSGVNLDADIQLSVDPTVGWEISLSRSNGYTNTLVLATNAPVTNPVLAADSAANYGGAGEPVWDTGANAGSGFGAWTNTSSNGTNSFAGSFLGSVTSLTNLASLYTDGQAFGLYADNSGGTGASSTAERAVALPLNVGDSLQASIGFCFTAGNRGFTVSSGGSEVFFFDINDGGFFWSGSGSAPLTIFAGVREFGQLINFSITRTASGFDYSISSPQDAGLTQTGSVVAPAGLEAFRFYINGAGGGDQNNFFFNNIQVVRGTAGASVEPTTVYARISATAPVTPPGGTYTGTVTATSAGATPQTVSLAGFVSDTPEITSASAFTAFLAMQGFPSDSQSFSVGGNNLEAGVLVDPPTDYEVSLDGTAWSPTVTVARTGLITPPQTVYIRIVSGVLPGTPGGDIVLSSTNAVNVNIPVTGQVISNTGSQLTANPSALPAFATDLGTNSLAQTSTLTGQGLSNIVSVTAPSGFEISTNGTNFSSNSTLTPRASGFLSNAISVRMTGTTEGIFSGNVSATSGATNASVAVQGAVYAGSAAQIAAAPTNLSGFTTVEGAPSASQPFRLSARNLGSNDLVVAAPPDYEVSTNSTNFFAGSLTFSNVSGSVAPATVYARIAASATAGPLTGDVVLSSGSATPVNVTLNGNVDPLRPPSVTLDAPTNDPTIIAPGSTIRLQATALDTNVAGGAGTLATFEFLTNGVPIPGAVTNNVSSPATFQYDWATVPGVDVMVSARAVDSDGLSGESLAIQVRNPEPGEPVVGFISPVLLPTNTTASNVISAVTPAGDGGFYIAGRFTNVNGSPRRGLARLTATGQLDPTFDFGDGVAPSNSVRTMVRLGTNGLLIGGSFTNVQGTNRFALAKLGTNGLIDPSFNANISLPPTNASPFFVQSVLPLPDGKILIGGDFDIVGGVARRSLARLNADGSVDTAFDTRVIGTVNTIARQPDGRILVGGVFTGVRGVGSTSTFGSTNIARFNNDGIVDTNFVVGRGFNGAVQSIAVNSAGDIYAAGSFTSYKNASFYRYLAQLGPSGGLAGSFNYTQNTNTGLNGLVSKVLPVPGTKDVLVAGAFTSVGNYYNYGAFSFPYGRVVQLESTGLISPDFNPIGSGANGAVTDAAMLSDGNWLLSGTFTTFNDLPYSGVVVLTGPRVTTGYAAWVAQWGLTNGAPGAILNPAGIPNLMVYALSGGDPRLASPGILPNPQFVSSGGTNYVSMLFRRNPDAVGVDFYGEYSDELRAWSTDGALGDLLPGDYMRFRATVPASLRASQFLRLKVLAP